MLDVKNYRVSSDRKVKIEELDPSDTSSIDEKKSDSKDETRDLVRKLDRLQETLYAEHKHKVLIILQGMDTAGKDGVIRRIFEGVNPAGVRVVHFREPTQEEIDHGFLWKASVQIPGKGEIVIFNRSYYEGVLVERVHEIVPKEIWQARYDEINSFEELLVEEGTTILKFFLHIDSDTQKKRLEERIQDPTKEWKFSQADLMERKFWNEYMKAYEDLLNKTSTQNALWYAIPSNRKWFRDLAVATIIVETLEKLKMRHPKLSKELKGIKWN